MGGEGGGEGETNLECRVVILRFQTYQFFLHVRKQNHHLMSPYSHAWNWNETRQPCNLQPSLVSTLPDSQNLLSKQKNIPFKLSLKRT